MNKSFGNDDPRLSAYIDRVYQPDDPVLIEVRERSVREGLPDIQLAALDGRHLEILTRMLGARRAVEIGTLGGYSGICILRGLAAEGILHTIEIDARHAAVAMESFRRAGFAERARIHIGPASDVLPQIAAEGPFDLVFIDADKEGYAGYIDWRTGGAVIGDNAFLFGRLPDAPPTGPAGAAGRAMQAFHQTLAMGGQFRSTVFPTGEGLAVGIRI
jgi:caffeoyl-CoA O-methyltransferase